MRINILIKCGIWGIAVFAIFLGIYFCVHSENISRDRFESVLGVDLSGSATVLNGRTRNIHDSKVVELWAVVAISFIEAKHFAEILRVGECPASAVMLPIMNSNPSWWIQDSDRHDVVSNQWMKANGNLRPSMVALWWSQNRLYVYFHGVEGSGRE